MTAPDQYASVRYVVDDVPAAIDFYTTHLGFTLNTSAAPAFAGVVRGPLRLLLSGPASNLIELFQPAHRPTSPAEAS
jgi:catechol 2,3-dioxygenase-like lactoylglutathione lyase family enzyme